MTRERLDLQKIRRNWELASATVPVRQRDRLASVRPPLDPFAAGRDLLDRLRREVELTFPEQRAALAPFIMRAETSFEQLRAAASDPKLHEAFTAALCDLEDICEAFLGRER